CSSDLLPISRLGSLNPLVECLFADNPDSDWHEGMVLAAKLRALPVIHPGLLGLEPSCRNATGDSVHLGSERRNGPVVDHVVRRDEHMDDLVDRNCDLVIDSQQTRLTQLRPKGLGVIIELAGQLHASQVAIAPVELLLAELGTQQVLVAKNVRRHPNIVVRILVLPEPRIADGLNGQVGLRIAVLQIEQLEGGDRNNDQDENGNYGPHHFQERVVSCPRWGRIGLFVELEKDGQQEKADEAGYAIYDHVDEVVEVANASRDLGHGALHSELPWRSLASARPCRRGGPQNCTRQD